MCFARQRRALFRHLNFQNRSDTEVLCTFFTSKCALRHNGVCFSTSQLPKVVWDRQSFTLLTSKCASRHNGVQFFISHLARRLRTRRFSKPTFRPSGAINHWKNTADRDFYLFPRIFCLLTVSSLIFSLLLFSSRLFSSLLWLFPPLLFHLSILSEVWLLIDQSIAIHSMLLHLLAFYPWFCIPCTHRRAGAGETTKIALIGSGRIGRIGRIATTRTDALSVWRKRHEKAEA